MRIIGLLTATVLVLCLFTYLTHQRVSNLPLPDGEVNGTDAQKYSAAIMAAKDVVRSSEVAKRRNFVLEMRLAPGGRPGAVPAADNPVHSTEGYDAEILVVTSNSMANGQCEKLAAGEFGSEAGSCGFIELKCRNRTTGAEYEIPLGR